MECDICGKAGSLMHPLHCITCARSYLEQPRIDLAKTLIDKDGVERHVTAIILGSEDKSSQHVSLTDSKGGLLVDRQECTNHLNWQRTKAETAEIHERMQLISDQTDRLRAQMDATRKQLEAQRAANAQRKSDFSSATYGVESRRANEMDKVQQHVKRIDYKSDKMHHDTMELRMQLCTTAAKLAGLKTTRRRNKDGSVKEVVNIGPGSRLRIWDLRDLNDAPPDQLSASLGAVAQLLVRVAAYMGIRLPAEITLPHNDYPQPTIFSPASSYQGKKVPFPGSTPSHSSSNSPEASRTIEHRIHLPKPRTLFVDRPLGHLSAEDPPAYSSFIEGVSLLAYNVAWLCRVQGMKESFKQWEDICTLGRSLHRLLISQETYSLQRPENPLDKELMAKPSSKSVRRTPVSFGQLSHATSHSFMNTAENAQYLSGWSISPTKIVDELKAFLLAEQQAQEWDVLSQKEWEGMENLIAEDPIIVGEKRRDNSGQGDGRSYLTSTTTNGKSPPLQKVDNSEAEQAERKRGTSGWMKLKSRPDDPVKKEASE
ncbi:UV radiation resistance protein and autophagy-related subunit 14-domain-containing protein [Paraphoma chrysanthemicola]|uniref:Autophagy-related protein 14 n=1 Tax=Paraphoma chrysanthemicola TaxID=798071 RepID=A0A8K0R617_9PLEO|nr:UV radiation resistance protein and autophagy-related subunit 14-domain-containing protein [Paraphoma chrysanthemicola]